MGGVIPPDVQSTLIHKGLTCSAPGSLSIMATENIKTTNEVHYNYLMVKEGQTHPPTNTTTIDTYLDGNTKYVGPTLCK